jgi:hypothetical protein
MRGSMGEPLNAHFRRSNGHQFFRRARRLHLCRGRLDALLLGPQVAGLFHVNGKVGLPRIAEGSVLRKGGRVDDADGRNLIALGLRPLGDGVLVRAVIDAEDRNAAVLALNDECRVHH